MKKSYFILVIAGLFYYFPLMGQQRHTPSQYQSGNETNPMITGILEAISQDSIAATMQMMVDMGTRFMYAPNHREVAARIAGKFRSYGYTDVVLDSFRVAGETVPEDSVWQFNVIATYPGTSAPGEVYILGAHHDDYIEPDPHQPAPGADDNASGCAAAIEIARVFKAQGFQPASTIRFVTYAAEELTGYLNYSGSIYYADKLASVHEDVRMSICNDMIGYPCDTAYSIFGYDPETGSYAWVGDLTRTSALLYTSLRVVPGNYPPSDAYHFHELGFCVTGFDEFGLNPNWHTVDDSVSNCNMDFCREVVKANCAILLNEQLTPVPRDPSCSSGESRVTISWMPTANSNVKEFRIYRSEMADSGFILAGQTSGSVFTYTDTTVVAGVLYHYFICSVNEQHYESIPSNTVRGAATPMNRELLVVKDSQGGFNNPPDSAVSAFYREIFHDLPYDYSDASVTDSLDISVLGRYQRIVWLSNAYSEQKNSSFRRNIEDITSYVNNGGQLFLSGFQPSFFINGNLKFNAIFNPADTISKVFKISEVARKPQAALNGSWPVAEGYDTLRIDSSKCYPQVPGHVINVECIYPSADAKVAYRFNSGFDTTSIKGSMKGKPVGIEYLGDDYKVIILSVPLFYLDPADAKKLVELVVKEKFKTTVGFKQDIPGYNISGSITVSPNPGHDFIRFSGSFTAGAEVCIEVYSMMGKPVFRQSEGMKNSGNHQFILPVGSLSPGVYLLVLRTGTEVRTGRVVII